MDMDYKQFKEAYNNLIESLLTYTPNQVGAQIYSEKLADICEMYPEYEIQIDLESHLNSA
jgi:hypothetical protein